MFAFYCRLLPLLTFLFYTLPTTGADMSCYRCDALHDGDCDDPFNTTLYTPESCMNDNFACLKQHKINKETNRTYLHRGCIQKHYCEIKAKAADFCITCTTSLCNSSPAVLPSFIISTFVVVKWLLLNKSCIV